MNKLVKSAVVLALFAGTTAANATLVSSSIGSNQGSNEIFLAVYDADHGKTYNLDMNVTWDQIVADATTAFAGFTGTGFNLGADAKWNAFIGGVTNTANVTYALAVGNTAAKAIAVTGVNPIQQNASDITIKLDPAAQSINDHANQINAGLNGANSSLIDDNLDTPLTGQMNPNGLPSMSVWTGWATHDPLQTYGSSVAFWLGSFHNELVDDGFDLVPTDVFTNADVTKLGNFTLAGNTLTFNTQVAAVPLPGAVWMFMAGLMGLVGVNRRKAA